MNSNLIEDRQTYAMEIRDRVIKGYTEIGEKYLYTALSQDSIERINEEIQHLLKTISMEFMITLEPGEITVHGNEINIDEPLVTNCSFIKSPIRYGLSDWISLQYK